jgi:hypothetical protein
MASRPYQKHQQATACLCEEVPPGTILLSSEPDFKTYLDHLVYVCSGNSWYATSYSLCPYTGILWIGTYVHGADYRIETPAKKRTALRQPPLERYTIAAGVARLYPEPRYPPPDAPRMDYRLPKGVSLPQFPTLPLQGRMWELLDPIQEVQWVWDDFHYAGKTTLKLWLHLFAPLDRGGAVKCWLASPLEVINRQVLLTGMRLEWWFAGGQIGEVEVQYQQPMLAEEFFEWFGFDKEYRNLDQEFSDWLDEVHGRRRRRRR